MQELTDNVFFHEGFPNCGCVVTSEGVLAVDGPMDPAAAVEWREFMASKGPLRYVVHTEHHADHIAANHFLGGTGVASEVTDALFEESFPSSEAARERLGGRFPGSAGLLEGYEVRRPEIVYRDRLTLRLGGQTFRLIHAPGHTRGQTVVHAVEARVVFTGDNITPGMHAFFHSASVWEWFRSVALLESLDVDWYAPGHGDPAGKDEIPRQRRKMLDVVDGVRALKAKGLSREETIAQGSYIDRPGLAYPKELGERARVLESGGLGNIFDQLEEHPAG
ncbi:MAG: MBL fold metallo-hydrolase [bacterium]